jgi:hypothetical protein
MIDFIVVSAVLMVKPNCKCAKGENLAVKTAGSEASIQESSFVDCYLEASVPTLREMSLALQLGHHGTAHLCGPLLYGPLRLIWPFEATEYLSFAAIARN